MESKVCKNCICLETDSVCWALLNYIKIVKGYDFNEKIPESIMIKIVNSDNFSCSKFIEKVL